MATTLADFRRREWAVGEDARRLYSGTATEMGAAVEFAERRPDWHVTFLRAAAAAPGGPVTDAAFEAIRAELLAGLAARRWDAVYLSLHGALVTERRPTPELDLLGEVRAAIGETRLGISLDLHGNVGPPLLDFVDVAVGYKTYPHTDMRETGAKALRLLAEAVEGRVRPTAAMVKVPAILASFNMRTTDGPMAEAAALARACEARPGVLDATLFGGFAYGDSPQAGAAALVTTDGDPALAGAVAAELAEALWTRRDRFSVSLPTPAEGIAQALAEGAGPVAVLDPADNPLSGGIGDTPGLFRALLAARPPAPSVFAFFWDPDTVAAAHESGVGGRLEL
ncbi:MAG: M81 family metallopeptidase, partial [Dongiaceae bacterium]